MNTRYTTVNLDVSQQGSIPSITLSQYDLGVGLGFYIMDGGLPYSAFAETDTVVLSGTKPSGVGFTIPAYYKSENLCSFRTTQAMTTEAGTVTCEITITKVNNISVSTANFFVEVEASAHAHETVDEDIEDFGLIADQVGEYKVAAVRAAQQAAQSATNAATSASSAEESMEAAQSAASSAIAAKDDIQEYIDDSEAWARGTRGGEAVPSTDETYENNAKYYAEQSSQASIDAGVSATEAAASAQEAAASVVGAVKYTAQTLTTEQKAQARTNIGAASSSDIPSGTVRYDISQSLTDAQKTQAKANIGVPAIDATLAVTGAAADAKKVGDEITDIKGDLKYDVDFYTSNPTPGITVFDLDDVSPGDHVTYSMTLPPRTGDTSHGYIELFDIQDNRLGVYGRISSSDATTQFNGSFDIPSNFSYAKWKGFVTPLSFVLTKTGVEKYATKEEVSKTVKFTSQNLTDAEKAQVRQNIGVREDDVLFSGTAVPNQILFTKLDISEGELIYIDFTVTGQGTSSATVIYFKDANDNNLAYFGKSSSSMTNSRYVGVLVIPDGFDKCIVAGSYNIIVSYISKKPQKENLIDFFNEIHNKHKNILEYAGYVNDAYLRAYDGATISGNNTLSYTSFIPVIPGSVLKASYVILSSSIGTIFYNANQQMVNCELSVSEEIHVPEDACYARFTVRTSEIGTASIITYKFPFEKEDYIVNPYKRYEIHRHGTLYNGTHPHVGFPRTELFNGKILVLYGATSQHLNLQSVLKPLDILDSITIDGKHEHIMTFTGSSYVGLPDTNGLGLNLSASKDGNYLLASGSSLYPMVNSAYYSRLDTVILCFDKNLNLVDYVIDPNVTYYLHSRALITPSGHILIGGFGATGTNFVGIARSNEVFNGSVTNLTFEFITLETSSTIGSVSEISIGYFNDKLVTVIRRDGGGTAIVKYTENLEGIDGWSSVIDLGVRIDDPCLMQYRKGNYLPLLGTLKSPSLPVRTPYLFYLNKDDFSIAFSGSIDDSLLPAYNGYVTGTNIGDETYAVAYYQETTDNPNTANQYNSFAGVYYKWIKAKTIIPGAQYIDFFN